MLPAVMQWNLSANAQRQDLVSEAMGEPGEPAHEVLHRFIADLGLPRRLSDVGVAPDQFEVVARNAMHDRYIHVNPRPISGPEDIMEILELAR